MDEIELPTDLYVKGQGRFGSLVIPPGSVKSDSVANGQQIPATVLQQQHSLHYYQAAGAAVVSQTIDWHIARGAGSVIQLSADVDTAPTGADRTIVVDLQKGNQATGFATLLTTTITINNTTVAREVKNAVPVGTPTYAAADTLRLIVTVAGAAGAQGQGLNVTLYVRENADP